jgi:hypothetical protein
MVKNSHNNKVNNYINIVNDLKGLGLLQKRRRKRSNSEEREKQQKSMIYKPQGISGIERTIIDNSPQLRRDVQQLANERSLLDGRLMENDNKLNFLHEQINQNPLRFMVKTEPQRNLSDVQGNSLYLPSLNQQYNDEIKSQTDSIDVPIVDASSQFKRHGIDNDEEQSNYYYTSDAAYKSGTSIDDITTNKTLSSVSNTESSIYSNNTPLSYKSIYGNISQIEPEINPMISESIPINELRSEQKASLTYNPYQDKFNRLSPGRKLDFKNSIDETTNTKPSPLNENLADLGKAFGDLKTNAARKQFLDLAKEYSNQKSPVDITTNEAPLTEKLTENQLTDLRKAFIDLKTNTARKQVLDLAKKNVNQKVVDETPEKELFDLNAKGPSSKSSKKKKIMGNEQSPKTVKMHGKIPAAEDSAIQRVKREQIYEKYKQIAEQLGVVVKPRSKLNTLTKIKAELDNFKTMKDIIVSPKDFFA